MSTQKILDEMLKATGLKAPRRFDGEDQEFLDKLSDKLSALEDDEFDELSKAAQSFANKMNKAANAKEEIPGFNLDGDDDDDEEDPPKRRGRTRRGADDDDDDDDEPPKRRGRGGKSSKPKEEELEFGELEDDMEGVKITSDKGRTVVGKVVEKDRTSVWLEDEDGKEHGFKRDRIDTIFLLTVAKDDDDEDDDEPPKRGRGRRSKDDDDDEPPKRRGRGRSKDDDDEEDDGGKSRSRSRGRGSRSSGGGKRKTKVQKVLDYIHENGGKSDSAIVKALAKDDVSVTEQSVKRYRTFIEYISKLNGVDWE